MVYMPQFEEDIARRLCQWHWGDNAWDTLHPSLQDGFIRKANALIVMFGLAGWEPPPRNKRG